MRAAFDLGLKEAKEIVDVAVLEGQSYTVQHELDEEKQRAALATLEEHGVKAQVSAEENLRSVKKAALIAISMTRMEGQDLRNISRIAELLGNEGGEILRLALQLMEEERSR